MNSSIQKGKTRGLFSELVPPLMPNEIFLPYLLTGLTLLATMLFCRLLIFFKINFFDKFFQEYHQSVKQFGSRSGPIK